MNDDEPFITRLRRRLAYALLPDTSELAVALARNAVLGRLEWAAREAPNSGTRQAFEETHRQVRENIRVRPRWEGPFPVEEVEEKCEKA